MKKLFLIMMIATIVAACNGKSDNSKCYCTWYSEQCTGSIT